VAVILSATLLTTAAHAQIQPPPSAATDASRRDRILPLEVSVNGAKASSWTLLERDGTLYAPVDAFDEWRLNRAPGVASITHLGQQWFPLASVPGFKAQMNYANQSVDLVFSPSAFAATRLGSGAAERPPVTEAAPAVFVNYDLNFNQSTARESSTIRDLGGLAEVGFANRWGVLTTSILGRNLAATDPSSPRTLKRLETTFTRDFPDRNFTLRLGDSTTRAASWGRAVYFGGVQIGRNFGLRPGFITQPIPVLAGSSTAPSTVELYINDALRQTSQVPTGPFAIDNFPLLTGSGQARVVVRDVLGRETVLVQDFFSHPDLLEQGLTDWSIEAGAVHRNIGTRSADYGQRFVAGLWRQGLSKGITWETRAEASRLTQGAGLGLAVALPWQLLGHGAAAISRDDRAGRGHHWVAGLENSNLKHGFSLSAEGSSRNYRQIGQESDAGGTEPLPFRRQLSASYTYMTERYGSLGVAFARVDSYDRGPVTTYSANYAVRLGARSSLTFNVVHASNPAGGGGTSVGVTLLIPLERQVTVASSLSHRKGGTDGYASASQGLTAETGWGWRTLAGRRTGLAYAEGGVFYQGTKGQVSADMNASTEQQTVRLGAQGGLVMIDGQVFTSRPVQDSFALVEVPGYANVGVGSQGRLTARTGPEGKALVTGLLSYQSNSVRLDPSELPISAEIDNIEQMVVPPARSGVIVKFPVRLGRGALIRIVFDDGQPAPAGAEIELVGDKQEFFVARRGEAFVTGLQDKSSIRLKWAGQACTVAVELPPGSLDEIARVGPLTCSGVRR
jgi:outer membrane usher protein